MNVQRTEFRRNGGSNGAADESAVCGAVPGDLLLGDTDPNGKVVSDIYWTSERFQIYLADNEVRYLLEQDSKKAAELRKSLHAISHERETIEYRRKHDAIGDNDRNYCARLLARCTAQAFEGNASTAKLILNKLAARLSAKIQSHFRMKYAFGSAIALCLVLACFVVVLMLAGMKSEENALSWLPVESTVLARYGKLCIFGALGAFLSVSIGLRSINFDLNLSKLEHIHAGGIRIIIGVIGAIAVGLALDSKLLAPTFNSETGQPVYYLMAFLAGFSETFVPNVLRKAEESSGAVNAQAAPQDNKAAP